MRMETDRIMSILGADPLSAKEITDMLYPELDKGSRNTRKGNIYKTLAQMEQNNMIERMQLTSADGKAVFGWVSKVEGGPSMNEVLEAVEREPTDTRRITERLYGESLDVLTSRVYRILVRLEIAGRVERFPVRTDMGSYVAGWRLSA